MAGPCDLLAGREVLVEFRPCGAYMKASALDAASLVEVSVQGPAAGGREALERAVVAKLAYMLRKKGIV